MSDRLNYAIQRMDSIYKKWETVFLGEDKNLPYWILPLADYLGKIDFEKKRIRNLGVSVVAGKYFLKIEKMAYLSLTKHNKIELESLPDYVEYYFGERVFGFLTSEEILSCHKENQYYWHETYFIMQDGLFSFTPSKWEKFPEIDWFIEKINKAKEGNSLVRVLFGYDGDGYE